MEIRSAMTASEASLIRSWLQSQGATESPENWETLRKIRRSLGLRPSKYVPHWPTPRQQEFLDLDCDEAFYGGAVGGGKSDALLMWVLEKFHVPGYNAVMFRRTHPELAQPGGLIHRSQEWLKGTGARWNGNQHRWTSPEGGTLTFMSLQYEMDKYKLGSSEFHRMGFDESTTFSESLYDYARSRLRRVEGFPVKPQCRCASNPGGEGHQWHLARFITKDAQDSLRTRAGGIFWKDGRAFVPASMYDNPYLNKEEYLETLSSLDPVTRERLVNGDWSVVEDAVFRPEWFRYWRQEGEMLLPMRPDGTLIDRLDSREMIRITTIDTAGTSQQRLNESKGHNASWSVVSTWDYAPGPRYLFLRNIWRQRVAFTELCEGIREQYRKWKPERILIENAHFGPAVFDLLKREHIPIELQSVITKAMKGQTGVDRSGRSGKYERSTPFINMMYDGRVFFPKYQNAWMGPYTSELLSWTGQEGETADQIDASSYAANYFEHIHGAVDWAFDPRTVTTGQPRTVGGFLTR